LSKDPVAEQGGENLYVFLGNSALDFVDINGLAGYKLGPPTEPSLNFDHTFPFDPQEHATIGDRTSWVWWGTKAAIASPFLPDAVRAYRHYRDGSGADLPVDYQKAYRDDSLIKQWVDMEIMTAGKEAEQLWDGKSASFQMTGGPAGVPNGTSENWQKTIGAHFIWGSADVRVKCPAEKNGKRIFEMTITINERDMYNFNPGSHDIASGTPDNINGRFSTLGWAREFRTLGSLVQVVAWKQGEYSTMSIP
jgi:hypothetical protein